MAQPHPDLIPALGVHWLTPFFDSILHWTMRDAVFKRMLIEQARVGAGQRILDVGCGTGSLALQVQAAAPSAEIVGLDGDAAILAIARAKCRSAEAAIRFDEGLSYALPYDDASFDRVFSTLMLHHLTDAHKMETLREAHRVLRPGGELHVADWGRPRGPMMAVLSLLVRVFDGAETTAANLHGAIPRFMEEAGFVEVLETRTLRTLFGTLALYSARKR